MEEFREILADIAKKDVEELATLAKKAIKEKTAPITTYLENEYSYCSDGIAEWEKKLRIKRKGDIWK